MHVPRSRPDAAALTVLVLIAAACGSGGTRAFTRGSRGSVTVTDPRGDASPQIDIVRAGLTLADGRFVARITTVEPISGSHQIVEAAVFLSAAHEDWVISGDWYPYLDESGELTRAVTTCTVVENDDFEHARQCRVGFSGTGATLRFDASLLRGDGRSIGVQFATKEPLGGDVAPNDRHGRSTQAELVVTR